MTTSIPQTAQAPFPLTHNGRLAIRLAEHGLTVFPCRNEPGDPDHHKKPLIKWSIHASKDIRTIESWWRKWPDALPAITTKPSDLVVLDGDRHHENQDGVESLKNLFNQHGCCPSTPMTRTPRDGLHIFLRPPPGVLLSNSSGGLPEAIDIKAAGGEYGGYVIAPGARVADGGVYEEVKGSPDFFEAIRTNTVAVVPDWLVAMLQTSRTYNVINLSAPLPAPGITIDLVKANALIALRMVCATLADTQTHRGTETFKQAAVMGGWAALGAITYETIWNEFVEAAKINRHLEEDSTDFTRSFERGYRTGYLKTVAEGHVRYLPIGMPSEQPSIGMHDETKDEQYSIEAQSEPQHQQNQSSPLPGPTFNDLFHPPAGLQTFRVDELLATPAPQRKWRVYPSIPQSEVTLLAGDGGAGKSTLCLQLAMACAGEKDWLRIKVEPCNVLYVSAEDPRSELHHRLEHINKHSQIPSDKLAFFKIIDLSGIAATALAISEKQGQIRRTPLFDEIEQIATEHKAGLVILDAAADFFGGNENERREVRAFIGLLRGLAMRLDAAILVIAHPSVDGMRTDRGYSGSTHWNNSVRSRLTFKGEQKGEQTDTPNLDVKVLELAKSNRARPGEKVRMAWMDGRFVQLLAGESANPSADEQDKKIFLKLLEKLHSEGRLVVPQPGKNYAPAVMAKRSGGKDIGKARLEEAMNALFDEKRIIVDREKEGPPSKQRRFLAVKEEG